MTKSQLIPTAAAGSMMLLSAFAYHAPASAQSVSLRHIGGWVASDFEARVVEAHMLKNINELAKGRLSIKRTGGPEIVPAEQQLAPLIAGAYDTIYTSPGYFSEYTVLGNVPTLLPKEATVKLRQECGMEAVLEEVFRVKARVAYLGSLEKGSSDRLYLRNKPIDSANLAGIKLRSSASQFGAMKALGASPTNIPYMEVYSALERGVVDGAVSGGEWSAARDQKWQEVIKYAVDAKLAYTRTPIMMNLNTWNRLTPEQQQIVRDGINKSSQELPEIIATDATKARKEMEAAGVKFIKLPPAQERELVKTYQREALKFTVTREPDYGAKVMTAVDCIWSKL